MMNKIRIWWLTWRRNRNRAKFTRLVIENVIMCAERQINRDLNADEAESLLIAFKEYLEDNNNLDRLYDNPVREINLFVTVHLSWEEESE